MVELNQIIIFFFLFVSIILIATYSGFFSERVGIVNIAIDGMMIIGATFFGLLAQSFKTTSPIMSLVVLLLASLITMLFSALHGLITIKLKGNHIISGVAINLLAGSISVLLLRFTGANAQKFQYDLQELAASTDNSNFLNIISLKVVITILIFVFIFIAFKYTKWGLRLKSIGENPQAADAAGINVNFYKWQGVLISGFLAGIAGSIWSQYLGVAFSGNVSGLGFIALTILIMGRWKVVYIAIASIIFSLIYSVTTVIGNGSGIFESIKTYQNIFYLLPYLVTLIILIFTSKNIIAPKAVGLPYDKSLR
ncbi:ABC transporter permease [Mesomycoplasma hyorhinis]|uniref:ABC transporter permease n=1 Tax=Mesomycoplasma hyorhinis TaxID=2100 RepID=UPI001C0433EC|nr:ABC transporter permease [Mesomycoplasma hyorhinis]